MAVQTVAPETALANFFNHKKSTPVLTKLTREGNPLWDWIPKSTDGGGDELVIRLKHIDAKAIAPTRAYVQTMQATSCGSISGVKFEVPWGGLKMGHIIYRKDLVLNRKDPEKFLDLEYETIQSEARQWGERHENYVTGNTGHALGSGVFTTTGSIQLANKRDAIKFQKGQMLWISANDGTATGHVLVAGSAIGYVIAVNENTGVITVSDTDGGAAADPTNWVSTTTYYYFNYGDFGGTTTPYKICDGIADWVPKTDPDSTAFNGVDRTASIVALSGCRLLAADVSGLSIVQRFMKAADYLNRVGYWRDIGGERRFWTNDRHWRELHDALQSVNMISMEQDLNYGGMSISLVTPSGKLMVSAAPKIQDGDAWLLTKNSWDFKSAGPYPATISEDGMKWQRVATADAFEMRDDGIGALGCRLPGANCYFPLAT